MPNTSPVRINILAANVRYELLISIWSSIQNQERLRAKSRITVFFGIEEGSVLVIKGTVNKYVILELL